MWYYKEEVNINLIGLQRLLISRVSLAIDFIFKLIFSRNKEILKDILKSITKYDIKDIKISSKDFTLDKYRKDGKFGILDIMAESTDNTKFNIEMQMIDNKNTIERLLFYQSGMYYQSIKSGEDYIKTKNIVVIGILNYELFDDEYNYLSQTNYVIQKVDKKGIIHEVQDLNTKLKMFLIELPKFKKMKHNLNDKLEQWLTALSCDNLEEMETVMQKNKNIELALDEALKLSNNEEVIEIINKEEDEKRTANDIKIAYTEKGIKQGIAQGITQGEYNSKKALLIKLIELNKNMEEIELIMDLNNTEIEKLKKEIYKN